MKLTFLILPTPSTEKTACKTSASQLGIHSGYFLPIDTNLTTSPDRSPNQVSLKDMVMRFSHSPERRAVLKGFLNYRAALHRLGLTEGFQWLDGSFFEDVETIERRAPRDIDVVSFCHTPDNFSVTDADAKLFDQAEAKMQFKVKLDVDYVRRQSFWLDLKILFLTFLKVVLRDGVMH